MRKTDTANSQGSDKFGKKAGPHNQLTHLKGRFPVRP